MLFLFFSLNKRQTKRRETSPVYFIHMVTQMLTPDRGATWHLEVLKPWKHAHMDGEDFPWGTKPSGKDKTWSSVRRLGTASHATTFQATIFTLFP